MTENPSEKVAGPNAWLVDEMRDAYRDNPAAVTEEWKEVFGNGSSGPTEHQRTKAEPRDAMAPAAALPAAAMPHPPAPAPPIPVPKSATPSALEEPEKGEALRGAAARIVANMESSLSVPTATSIREVPAKLLEVNRLVLNNHLRRFRAGKTSFNHFIGYAMIQAIAKEMPALNNTFFAGADGKPRIMRNPEINLGIAVDQQKSDGSRTLIVPVIKNCGSMNFKEFIAAYEAVIAKVRANKITVDDLTGATVSLTNVGTLGTVQSVPRLMPGQGAIFGVGRIGYPTEFQAADPKVLAQLGVSKILAITSTYDHRIIQGAESGLFLKKVHEYLIGEDDFYIDCFNSFGVPYEPVKWRTDANATDDGDSAIAKQMAVNTLINQYRVRGHLIANTNPLSEGPGKMHPELDPASFGLTLWDLDREFLTGSEENVYAAAGGEARFMKLGDILGVLRDAYCRTIGIEYMHIADPRPKRWLQERLETPRDPTPNEELHHILERLTTAEAFEKFLAARYAGQKRFGLEGGESTIPVLDAVLSAAADDGMERVVIGMAHRGRLNVLANIMGKGHRELFKEFEGDVSPDDIQGSGDVKYHLGYVGEHESRNGNKITTQLAPNPSHLEAVDPVVVGMVRAFMDQSNAGNYPILPVLIHGDAAFAGQGVVSETLNLSAVHGFMVGGTVHVIINNQLGYTTAPHQSRSTDYSTDVAKAVQAPIFHVNADDPDACVRVAKLAFEFRQEFNKDVVIDIIGYRRHGHNEGDDPSYTQPLMYRKIANRPSARTLYIQALIESGAISMEEAETAWKYFQDVLQIALDETRGSAHPQGTKARPSPPPQGVLPHVETGVTKERLDEVYAALSGTPDGFTVHPKLARQLAKRDEMWASGTVDWALGEAMAYGTLLQQGISVRLAGQDSRRGTFAHRHATLHDYENGNEYTPLSPLGPDGTEFWVYDSTLSEYAGLGFEYGYSLANSEALVLWEAQFGDFVNGAQIIIDQFMVSAEDKWHEHSGLVMLLPHGFEGQGPEHSSARLERFLLACAEDNIQVAQPTTAAQFFHLIRRQMIRDVRKPLVLFAPKSGLRALTSRSPVGELLHGSFEEVLDDVGIANPSTVNRVIFASGKVGNEARQERDDTSANAAVIKVEQLYPWPFEAVADVLKRYSNATEIVWLQEEPENMGAWNSVKGRLYEAHGDTHTIRRISRTESGSPATGSGAIHRQEQAELLARAFAELT